MQPLPGGMVPPDQTVEGGGQIRVTPAGFNKISSMAPALVREALGEEFCLPRTEQNVALIGFDVGGIDLCYNNGCGGGSARGCGIGIDIPTNGINISINNNQTLRMDVQFGITSDLPIKFVAFPGSIAEFTVATCTVNIRTGNPLHLVADVGFGIRDSDGELTIALDSIQDLDVSGLTVGSNDCNLLDFVANIVNVVLDIISSPLGNFLVDLLTPVIDDLIQGFLPDPLGIEGVMDVGALVGTVSPGTNASLEVRGVPGGYVQLVNGGMSLGLITGLNADEDPDTRTADLDSEPALCVPPMSAPDFNSTGLPKVFRSEFGADTFILSPADEFLGAPDPASDIVIGLSETTLDLGGHHAVTSGLMCMGLGTSLIEQLNLGTIGILVPSLAELGSEEGTDPLLLVTRPLKALDFTIGEGTETDPSLTIHIKQFEIDFYAFIFERFVRGFTIKLDMDVGINLEFSTDAMGNSQVLPVISGLETENIGLTVHNAEFLREEAADLEGVLPAIFDLAVPLITDGLEPFGLPEFAGFKLEDLKVAKVATSEDDFLAIYATLGQSTMMAALADKYPSARAVYDKHMAALAPPAVRAMGGAELDRVWTPKPLQIRKALQNKTGGAMPEVVVRVDTHDDMGREIEWTWNLGGGLWHKFQSGPELTISTPAFALQGKFNLNLRSRVKGDYRTLDQESIVLPVVIDSVGPRIFADKVHVDDGKLVVPANDLVSEDRLTFAYGHMNDQGPATDFKAEWTLDEIKHLATAENRVRVYSRDELGNENNRVVNLGKVLEFHGSGGAGSGCDCASGGTDAASLGGLAVIAGLTLLLMMGSGRRQRLVLRVKDSRVARATFKAAPWIVMVGVMSFTPACSCGSDNAGDSCVLDEDCADQCPEGTIPLCFDDRCVCADDVPYGKIGQYSDMALSSSGAAWVSAYNASHGDLMVARFPGEGRIPNEDWEFVDGVPDGPVVLETSTIRSGIFEPGPDVGKYTSIAVGPDDTTMVAYFDVDNGALKFASNAGGVWTTHVVDEGNAQGDPELGYEISGQYTSITIASDGRPGIAYFSQVSEGGTVRTEVRYASAQTANPTSLTDWSLWVVDSAASPNPADSTDVFPIPEGVGLFVTSARLSDDTPVIVYYDRLDGDLMLARFDGIAGTFEAPVVLDGDDPAGSDVGWYPGLAVDINDELHITYVNATHDDLYYINTIDNTPEVVDDGYRIVGQTEDGLPKPEFHFVGDDSSVVLTTAGPVIVYQDATTHELLLAQRNGTGQWEHETIAGNEDPFVGGYGFYAAARYDGTQVVMSSWAVDQPGSQLWVEIFRKTIVVQ